MFPMDFKGERGDARCEMVPRFELSAKDSNYTTQEDEDFKFDLDQVANNR